MKPIAKLCVLVFSLILLSGCNSGQEEDKSGCQPPKDGFTEADLTGTWSHESLGDTDTLIIREDGTYKQILNLPSRPFSYESEWQPWRVEYAASGIPYLHLKGLRVCAYYLEIDCEKEDGATITWYDFCQEDFVTLTDEGILMVLGRPERFKQPPRGIELKLLTKYIEGVWWYELQETEVPIK